MPAMTVKNETELPHKGTYIRLNSDPLLVQHSRSGELFQRADRGIWPHGAYILHIDPVLQSHTVERKHGWGEIAPPVSHHP